MRILSIFLMVLVMGCEGAKEVKREGADKLTNEQKIAWKKKRREAKVAGTFQVVGCVGKDRVWRGYASFMWADPYLFPNNHDEASAKLLAKKMASDPEISVVVLVDLYSEESPHAVQFFRDDGNSVKTYPKAPGEEVDKGLRAYFLQLQRSLAP